MGGKAERSSGYVSRILLRNVGSLASFNVSSVEAHSNCSHFRRYIGILLDIGRQIEPIAQMYNSTYRVYTIVEQVVGLDGRQHGCSMDRE